MSVEYTIVKEFSYSLRSAIDRLETSICSLCSEGWEPSGGVCVCKIEDTYKYVATQAMIRKPK